MLSLLVAFISGAVCVLLVQLYLFVNWFWSIPVVQRPVPEAQRTTVNSEELTQLNSELLPEIGSRESCACLNFVLLMLFHEWKDSVDFKNFFIRKINAEIEELMFTKMVGKVLQQVKVCDYSFGPSLPFIRSATLQNMAQRAQGLNPDEIEIALDIDYCGGFHVSFDADLVFGRQAYVSVKVLKLVGCARFQMCCRPFPHWSLSFYNDPELVLDVKSQLEGRSLPQLSSLIRNQLKKAVRKKHTLPAYKVRFKPFFRKPQPQDESNEIYVHDKKITVGKLSVEVREASHLPKVLRAAGSNTYCTLEVSSLPKKTQRSRVLQWSHTVSLEVEVFREKSEHIGALFTQSWIEANEERRLQVVVANVESNSAASRGGLKRGDMLMSIGGLKVTSSDQAARLVRHCGQSVVLSVRRLLSQHTSRTGPDSVLEDSLSTDAGSQEAELRESYRQGPTVNDQSQTATQLPPELITQKSRRSKAVVSSECSGNDTVTDGGAMSRLESVPEDFVFVDSQDCTFQTSAVPHCHNPMWNELFEFSIADTDRYLNVSVWNQMQHLEGDMLIGHVSVPLMDISLQCLMTSSGSHVQHYVLVPAEPVKASRAEVRATGVAIVSEGLPSQARYSGNRVHAGALFLRFRHRMSDAVADDVENDEDQEEGDEEFHNGCTEATNDPVDVGNQAQLKAPSSVAGRHVRGAGHPLRPQVQNSHHSFVSTQFTYTCRCDFCNKKIWTKSGVQCRNCSMKCHIKCVGSCRSQSGCPFRRSSTAASALESETASGGGDADEEECVQLSVESGSCDRDSTPEIPTSGRDEATSMAAQAARQFGKELFPELHGDDRRDAINSKIAQLQKEMDRESRSRDEMRSSENTTLDEKQKINLMSQMTKLDDRLQALAFLMMQYLAALDAIESGDQENEQHGLTDGSSP